MNICECTNFHRFNMDIIQNSCQYYRCHYAGVLFWIQQRYQPSPLNIWLANVQVLNNKLDKLRAQIKHQKVIKNCCELAFTETWLEPSVSPEGVQFFSQVFTQGDILALNAMCNIISDSENSKPEAAFIV